MNQVIRLIIILIFVPCSLLGQKMDLIVSDKGDSIACTIDSITINTIYFEMKSNYKWIHTSINISQVADYKYQIIEKKAQKFKPGTSYIQPTLHTVIQTDNYAQYKANKTKYDYKNYSREKSDLYIPALNGGLSLIIPGSGQIIVGEYKRGFAFLGAGVGSFALLPIGYSIASLNDYNTGRIIFFTGLACLIAVDVWSATDASRVVKVNNLAWRDKNYTGYNIKLEPYIIPVHKDELGGIQSGLSLKINF